MPLEKIDYAVILTDLKAKRSALDTLISAYETAQSLGALGQPGDSIATGTPAASSTEAIELPVGAFRGKSIPAAIKLYLSAVKRKQTNQQITIALKDGGVESTGKLEQVVTGALNRLRASGEVLRFKDGWDLSEHHNAAFRARLSQAQQKSEKRGRKKRTAKSKVSKSHADAVPQQGLEQRILIMLRSEPRAFTRDEIATALSAGNQAVSLALGRMAARSKVERAQGGYRVSSNVQAMPQAV